METGKPQLPYKLPVALYVPNILGYMRIALAMYALSLSLRRPVATVVVWNISAVLDFFDGILARRLNQTSEFGVYLDIMADNILRGSCWMAYAIRKTLDNETTAPALLAFSVWTLEWITMLCTQLSSANDSHWKEQSKSSSSWLIRMTFRNNFKQPLGFLVIYGLFAANQFAYGSCFGNTFPDIIPLYQIWKWMAYIGRVLAALCECNLCYNYIQTLLRTKQQRE